MSRDKVDAAAALALADEVRAVAAEVSALQEVRDDLWARIPNLLPDDTPAAGGNVELRRAGDPVAADESRCHDTVGATLGVLDLTRGAEVAIEGFSYWRGDGARLAWAVFTHAQSLLLARGFTLMMPPSLVTEEALGQGVIGYFGDQILDGTDLPIRICAFVPCVRAFYQVEQIVLCRAEDSEHWLGECQRNAEDILRVLELPYRVVRVCLGDLSAPAYKTFETECWFPGSGAYRTTHSNSYLTDYQARRFKIRYLDRGRVVQPHTLAATGVTDRAVLAILENHARPDGSVRIPEALRPYLGGQELIEPKAAHAG